MTAANMADIREGLAANLSALGPGIQVSAYRMADPTMPSVQVVGLDAMTPTAFQRGGDSLVFVVQALAGGALDEGVQRRLDEFMYPTGTLSIWQALEADRTLGGTAATSTVLRNDGTQRVQLDNNTQALGSSWFVQVEL